MLFSQGFHYLFHTAVHTFSVVDVFQRYCRICAAVEFDVMVCLMGADFSFVSLYKLNSFHRLLYDQSQCLPTEIQTEEVRKSGKHRCGDEASLIWSCGCKQYIYKNNKYEWNLNYKFAAFSSNFGDAKCEMIGWMDLPSYASSCSLSFPGETHQLLIPISCWGTSFPLDVYLTWLHLLCVTLCQ